MTNQKKYKLLKEIEVYIPIHLKRHRQFINFQEYLSYNEFELALDSLIELNEEIQYDFLKSFWEKVLISSEAICTKNITLYSIDKLRSF